MDTALIADPFPFTLFFLWFGAHSEHPKSIKKQFQNIQQKKVPAQPLTGKLTEFPTQDLAFNLLCRVKQTKLDISKDTKTAIQIFN